MSVQEAGIARPFVNTAVQSINSKEKIIFSFFEIINNKISNFRIGEGSIQAVPGLLRSRTYSQHMYNQLNKIEAREALENTNENLGQDFYRYGIAIVARHYIMNPGTPRGLECNGPCITHRNTYSIPTLCLCFKESS